ncbi:MAG: phosphate butyryltransferase [Candidatus Coatesbacteria bacterium]|nr:MAG: phosphate butyryltransferase [Candidatus Coatesbacteria bacterium]
MLKDFSELVKRAEGGEKTRLALVGAQDGEALGAVVNAARKGTVEPILVGSSDAVKKTAEVEGIDIDGYEIVEPGDDGDAHTACQLVVDGRAQALMKGRVSTGDILRAVLDKRYNLRGKGLISHVILLENPRYHKLFIMTDVAMVVKPDLKQKIEITKNAVEVMHKLGVEKPKVGMICAVEKVNYEHMPDTVDAAIISQMSIRGQMGNCIIDGPLAFDNAISKTAAEIKGIDSPVAGDIDIAVLPDIEAANALYKGLMFLSDSKSAGIIVGSKVPIILLSRADTEECKYYSILLSGLVS